jgi:hypothetical protein
VVVLVAAGSRCPWSSMCLVESWERRSLLMKLLLNTCGRVYDECKVSFVRYIECDVTSDE